MRFDSRVALVIGLTGVLVAAVGAAWASDSLAHGAAGVLQLAVVGVGLSILAASGLGWVFFRVALAE